MSWEGSGHETRERRSLLVRLLVIGSKTVSMPPTKVCPQCKAAVPVRRKTCEVVNAVIMSFDPKEKQSVICDRKL